MLGLPTTWLAGGALALALAATGGAYLKGRADANGNCRAAALAAELATVRRDLAIARSSAAVAEAAQRTLAAEAEDTQRRIEAYERDLANRDPCALSPHDIDALGGLRREPVRGPR